MAPAAWLALMMPLAGIAFPIQDEEVRELIQKLADDSIEVREQATTRLVEIGTPAVPALKEALKSGDLEVAKRAEIVLMELDVLLPKDLAVVSIDAKGRYRVAGKDADLDAVVGTIAEKARKFPNPKYGEISDLRLRIRCEPAGSWGSVTRLMRRVAKDCSVYRIELRGMKKVRETPLPVDEGLSGAGARPKPVRVTMRRDGEETRTAVDGQAVDKDRKLADLLKGPLAKKPLILDAAADVPYRDVLRFLDVAHRVGWVDIRFASSP